MRIRKERIIIKFILILSTGLFLSCAQFVPPTGGKKDEKPPELIKSLPNQKSTNYKGKEIVLEFNEYVDANSLRQELLVVPELEGTYDIKIKSKEITIKLDKPLKENTTYTLNFRKGIKDLTERNEAKNLKLVFSTGENIDSLSIEGNVKSLFTNQPIFEALVGIYQITDSLNFRKVKPTYFTKTDSSGNFKFENIKSSNYRLYSFNDKNNNLKFDPKTEQIAFWKDTLKLTKNYSNINLKLYQANNEKPKNQKTLQRAEDFTVIYDKNIKDFKVKFESLQDSIPYIGNLNELKFYNFPQKTDTIKVEITAIDSANNQLIHSQKIKFREQEKKKKTKEENFGFTTNPKNGEEVENNFKLEIKFNNPIANIDLEKIKVVSDTVTKEKISQTDFKWNSYKNIVEIEKSYSAKRELKFEFLKGCFIDIKGDSSQKAIINFKILNAEDYGIIEGRVENDSTQKIIQLVDENYKVAKEEFTTNKFQFKNVKPNIYLIRTIIDSNKNGKWDFGDFDKNISPEEIIFEETPIKIKANFEIKDLLIKRPKQ